MWQLSQSTKKAMADIFSPDSMTYNPIRAVLWECQSRLTHGQNNSGIGRFHGIQDAKIAYYTRNLLTFPVAGGSRLTYGEHVMLFRLYYRSDNKNSHSYGINELSPLYMYGLYPNIVDRYSNSINSIGHKLYVAALVARLPILSIATADNILPKTNKDNSTQESFVHTTLEVKWTKVGVTVGAIIGGQILAVLAVLYYSRNVFIRDDSYLSTARLLKTIMAKIENGSLGTGEQLARYFDDSLGLQIRYGTKRIGGKLVVDLSDDVDLEQRFPQDQEYDEIPGLGPFSEVAHRRRGEILS